MKKFNLFLLLVTIHISLFITCPDFFGNICIAQKSGLSELLPKSQMPEKKGKYLSYTTKVYCYVAYDPTGKLPAGPAYTYLEGPDSIVSIANHSTANFVIGGTWGGNNKWYGAVYGDNTLITMDTVTGIRTIIGKMPVGFTGITYDYTIGTLFGMAWDGANSSLYKINQANAAVTLIGKSTKSLLINLACDSSGNLYSSSISNDTIYSINKITGAVTKIGHIGFHSGYAQGMEFNRAKNSLFMAAYNLTDTSGELRTVNVLSGATSLIGKFKHKAEITALAIPYHYKAKINDVSVSSIDMRPIVGPDTVSPKATVMNMGKNASFDVTMIIRNQSSAIVYQQNKTITNLATYDNKQITFPLWTPTIDNYTITVYTTFASDINLSNDTLKRAISVQKLIKAYCYVGYDPTNTLPIGPAYTYLQTPDRIFSLQDQSKDNFVWGGTWGGMNKWYAGVSGENNLVTIDTVTGARKVLGKTAAGLRGIAYDYKTSTLFGVVFQGGVSSLYKIDEMTGTSTLIGPSVKGSLINLACDTSGRLYSLSISNDTLYSINKMTGAGKSIGHVGFVAAYAQEMEFDRNTNILWMAAYNYTTSAGEMRIVDINTGATTLIGPFAGGSEITGFAIPYNAKLPANDVGVTSVTSPSDGCGLDMETLKVNLENLGTAPASNIPLHYSLDGKKSVDTVIAGPIPARSFVTHSFARKINISADGLHTVKVYTTYTGDKIRANDSTKYVVNHIPTAIAPFSMGFEPNESLEGWSIIDGNNDQVSWGFVKDSVRAHGGKYYAELTSNPFAPTDNDWLITKCIQLDSNKLYQLSYWYRAFDSTYSERMSVYLLNAPINTSVVKMINDLHKIVNVKYFQSVNQFKVPANDIYYFGFHCYSVSGLRLCLDDINISDISGVNDKFKNQNSELRIYPNPAANIINVFSTESINNIKLLNVFGQIIFTKQLSANNYQLTTNVDNGIYFLQIETKKGITTRKVIISK